MLSYVCILNLQIAIFVKYNMHYPKLIIFHLHDDVLVLPVKHAVRNVTHPHLVDLCVTIVMLAGKASDNPKSVALHVDITFKVLKWTAN